LIHPSNPTPQTQVTSYLIIEVLVEVLNLFTAPIYGKRLKHLNAYLDELEWRFNNRENPYLFNETLMKLIKSENLPYQNLIRKQ